VTPGVSPFAANPVVETAKQVRTDLANFAATAGQDPWWARRFWLTVWSLEQQQKLPPAVKTLMAGYGYVGDLTSTAPRVQELTEALSRLEAQTMIQTYASPPEGAIAAGKWAVTLPPTLRRAGTEIYSNIRGEGVNSVREWFLSSWSGSRGNPEYNDLWLTASNIDYHLGKCKSDQEALVLIATEDVLESSLRHLSAAIYEKRTGDKTGAAHMRAVVAPGTRDVAPSWLVSDATTFSKQEFQRTERVGKDVRQRGKGKGKKGDGKGKPSPP